VPVKSRIVKFANHPHAEFSSLQIAFMQNNEIMAFSVKITPLHFGIGIADWNIGNLCRKCLWIKIPWLSG
jgi:hypothetical protein